MWLQTIQVGTDYQAAVPCGLSRYGDAPGNHGVTDEHCNVDSL